MNDKLNAVIEKIKKLQALANGTSNKSESENAMASAARLMAEYQLSEAQLEIDGGSNDDPQDFETIHILYKSGRVSHWKYILAHGVAKLFGAYSYNMHIRNPENGRKDTRVRVVGKLSAIKLSEYTCEFLMHEIARWVDIEVPSRGVRGVSPERDSYCLGCVLGYLEKMNAEKNLAMLGASSAAVILMTQSAEKVKEEFMAKTGLELKRTNYRPKGSLNENEFARGVVRGNSFNVNPGLNGVTDKSKRLS